MGPDIHIIMLLFQLSLSCYSLIIITDPSGESTDVLLFLSGHINPSHYSLPQGAEVISTPINSEAWHFLLREHPDSHLVDYVLSGFRKGFHIRFNYQSSSYHPTKCKLVSARNIQLLHFNT